MTTIEKVARTIDPFGWKKRDEQLASLERISATGEPVEPDAYDGPEQYVFGSLQKARAVLKALKDPDEGTVEAMVARVHQSGCVLIDDFDASDAGNTFNAALDHIIKGGSE